MLRPLLHTALPLLVGLLVLACGGTDAAQSSASAPQRQSASHTPADSLPLAQVDSLGVPAQIATTDTLTVHLSGTVGPNGCYSLARIETERTAGGVTLRPVVQPPRNDDQMCTMALVPLDTTHHVAPPFETGTLTVTVPQQDRPAVTTTVTVADRPE